MRAVGFAPWVGWPSIDDPNQDDEIFQQQEQRMSAILALPDDEPSCGEI
jgi:hypothetical protein